MSKACSQCREQKDLEEFSKLTTSKDGRRSYCKACGQKYATRYRRAHREKMTDKHRVWRSTHREHVRGYQRDYQRWYREHGPVNLVIRSE